MYIVEIETKEMEKASEYAEKALKYMGKVMQCISSWEDEAYGERDGMNYRGGGSYGNRSNQGGRYGDYGNRRGSMGYRDEEEWDDEDDMMQERRGVRGSGRGRRSNNRYY